MNYEQTLAWMFAQLPMYQREGKTAFKKELTNIVAFSKELNFPEKKFTTIHVGGTNGKGSTSHLIASIFQEAGYKVGLYTSPHLKNFTERIRINGEEIPQEKVCSFIKAYKHFLECQQLSFFEMTVGMAFDYFASEKVDIAIIEVGLGGRLDSTNIITPAVSVITNIGLDHTQFLGETLSEIAFEKAGIIKENIPVVIGERQVDVAHVFISKAEEKKASISFASEEDAIYATGLLGEYQKKNSKTAVHAVRKVKGFYVSSKPKRHQQDLAITGNGKQLTHFAVGKINGGSQMTVIFLHGRDGSRHLGFDDDRFGGNFNRVKNLMFRNNGLYISADFSDFEEEGRKDIEALVSHYRPKTTGKLVIACGSMGSFLCWQLMKNKTSNSMIDGYVIMGGFPDPSYLKTGKLNVPDGKKPIYMAHGGIDYVYSWKDSKRYYDTLRQSSPGYPIRLSVFDGGKHGTPVRMMDWRVALNWIAAQP